MHQERHYPGRVMATDLVNPDFAAFARSFGAFGERVEDTGAFGGGAGARARGGRARAARARVRPRGAHAAPVALRGARAGRAQRGEPMSDAPHLARAAASQPRSRAGEISAEEVTRHHLDRIAAHEHLHAVITLTARAARSRARGTMPVGPLAGVPLLVKDIFDTAGVRTTYGSGDLPRQRAGALGHERPAARRRRRDHARQGQPARVRVGRDVAQPRLRRRRQQRAPRPHSGRLLGRQRERARGRAVRARARHRHRRLDPPAGRGLRRGRLQARVRQRAGRRPLAARALVRPRRPARALARRLRAGVRRAARRAAPAGGRRRAARPPPRAGATSAPTTEAFLAAAGLPAAPELVRLHLAECAEVHREIYASHRDAYDDDLHAKMAVGLRRVARGARRARRRRCTPGAPRARRGCAWDVLVSPAFPGELPPADVPATIELTDRMTAYTRPVNWLGWPSAVTADGVDAHGPRRGSGARARAGLGGAMSADQVAELQRTGLGAAAPSGGHVGAPRACRRSRSACPRHSSSEFGGKALSRNPRADAALTRRAR